MTPDTLRGTASAVCAGTASVGGDGGRILAGTGSFGLIT